MIFIKGIHIGNSEEAYSLTSFTDGLNIISSGDNHVGKTVVMQAMTYALGSDPMFPASLKYKDYVFIIDLNIDGQSVSILRNNNAFAVNNGGKIVPLETVGDFTAYWNENIEFLPSIVKDNRERTVPLDLYEQMAFMPQAKRNTARIYGGYYNKKDFVEMLFSQVGLAARQLDSNELAKIKDKKRLLVVRRQELTKQAKLLKQPGSALASISPTSDREKTSRFIADLDELKNQITDLQNKRNRTFTRIKKNEGVLKELHSLNKNIEVGALECLLCGSQEIGYRMTKSDFVFDLTTSDMRSQIIRSMQERIDGQRSETRALDEEIRDLQSRFNSLADTQQITLADVLASREGYADIEEIDAELTSIADELYSLEEEIQAQKHVETEVQEARKELRETIIGDMNLARKSLGADDGVPDYTDLFTSEKSPYGGSEATEFLTARVYAIAKHTHHNLPILIDSFRAEELSTAREEKLLPWFSKLGNQVILTATLKEQEAGKYNGVEGINSINFTSYAPSKLLSADYCDEFANKVAEFGVRLI